MCSEGYSTWSVIPSVCQSFRLSVITFSAATRNKAAKKRYQRVQCHTAWLDLNGDFCKNTAFKSYGMKTKSMKSTKVQNPWR